MTEATDDPNARDGHAPAPPSGRRRALAFGACAALAATLVAGGTALIRAKAAAAPRQIGRAHV